MTVLRITALWFLEVLLGGVVLKVLWGWFVSETFGIQEISVPQALGIGLLVAALTHQYHQDDREWIEQVLTVLVSSVLILLAGLIIHSFV